MFDKATATELNEVRDRLAAVLSGFDPQDMIASDANGVVEAAARIERLAASLKTLAMGRVDDAGTWRGQGHRSAEDWLAAKTGTSSGEARATSLPSWPPSSPTAPTSAQWCTWAAGPPPCSAPPCNGSPPPAPAWAAAATWA
jgi:hypothetical protein